MTNYFGHWLSGQSTSDPTWPILCGEIVTKLESHRTDSAQSTVVIYMGQANSSTHLQPFILWALASLQCIYLLGHSLYTVQIVGHWASLA